MSIDPRTAIAEGPMSRSQIAIVAVMIGLNALDGFDVLSISFASPAIAAAWRIDRAALGLVLSMELIGMSVGAVALGGGADRIGRRRIILGSLVAMGAGMAAAAMARDVVTLSGCRLLTGVGIGGMLAATNAAVAEAASTARRNLCVVLMAAGYPLGTVVGGVIATGLLQAFGWPAIFVFGAAATLSFIPLVLRFAPESVDFLIQTRPPGALAVVNATLRRMGRPATDALPETGPATPRLPLPALFRGGLSVQTVLMTIAYFGQIMTFYFLLKWIPKIVVDMGYPSGEAGSVLVWASLGGATGALLLGLLSLRARVLALTAGAAALSWLLVTVFGEGQASLFTLSLMAAITGMATNAGVVGLYALVAERFPTALRATATGFVIGVGRGGSALAPALAGLLFARGYGLPVVAALMALGSAVALVALLALALIRPRRAATPLAAN